MKPAISIDHVSLNYGPTRALEDITLEIRTGEKVALLGPNGTGKTSLIEVIAGFRKPDSGSLTVLGHSPSKSGQIPDGIGLVLQNWRDHPKWKVSTFLTYVAASHRNSGRECLDLDSLLDEFRLGDARNQPLHTLSGGQRRKIDVIAALLGRPGLLILDEPTTGFDPDARIEFQRQIATFAASTTLLIATHDLVEADRLADRLLVMNQGRILMDGDRTALENRVGGSTTVKWQAHGVQNQVNIADPDDFIDNLYRQNPGQISDLEISRDSLEDLYLALQRSDEAQKSMVVKDVEHA